jgi:hypothetical protein
MLGSVLVRGENVKPQVPPDIQTEPGPKPGGREHPYQVRGTRSSLGGGFFGCRSNEKPEGLARDNRRAHADRLEMRQLVANGAWDGGGQPKLYWIGLAERLL